MPLSVDVVTRPVRNTAEIAPALVPGVRLLAEFRRNGVLERIGGFHLNRRSGAYDVLSVVALGVVFLLAGADRGLQSFCRGFSRELGRIARLAGLRRLPSAGALSRALSSVDRNTAEGVADTLLLGAPDMADVLGHPAVVHRDRHGDPWHVIDFDPTITAFRRRDLPSGEDLPAATRRAQGVPGYTGQKRGETRVRHLPLMHAGTGLWLAYRLEEPGTPGVRSLRRLLESARPWWPRLGGPERVVLRFDGEFGNVGGLRCCRAEGIHALGRIARYALLERPEIQAAVEAAVWREVPGSDSAKPTEAADLGWVTLHPSEGAVDAEDGPVEVRVVLSRLRPTDGQARHGVMIGDWQVEMFATTLEPGSWPAEEVVALYRGRAVIENRFAQEDREFATERTFSFHLWGQMLMVSIAMMLWNHLICSGFQADPPPVVLPSPSPRPPAPTTAAAPLRFASPASPAGVPEIAASSFSACDSGDPLDGPAGNGIDPAPPVPDPPVLPTPTPVSTQAVLSSLVEAYFSNVATQTGWDLHPIEGTVTCPNHTSFRVRNVDQIRHGKDRTGVWHRIILANQPGDCDRCPLRPGCFGSDRTGVAKRIARSVPASVAAEAAKALGVQRLPVAARRPVRQIERTSVPNDAIASILRPLPESPPGQWRALTPSFLPAAARKHARTALEGCAILRVRRTPLPAKPHPLIEEDRKARQHQRHPYGRPTWSAHVTLRVASAVVAPPSHWSCK